MMSQIEIEQLKTDLKHAESVASEKVNELQALVQAGLPENYERLPQLSFECYQACKYRADLTKELKEAELVTVHA